GDVGPVVGDVDVFQRAAHHVGIAPGDRLTLRQIAEVEGYADSVVPGACVPQATASEVSLGICHAAATGDDAGVVRQGACVVQAQRVTRDRTERAHEVGRRNALGGDAALVIGGSAAAGVVVGIRVHGA